MKPNITTDVNRGRMIAGPVLPVGAEIVGTYRGEALVRLRNGWYIGYAQGETRTVDQQAIRAALRVSP